MQKGVHSIVYRKESWQALRDQARASNVTKTQGRLEWIHNNKSDPPFSPSDENNKNLPCFLSTRHITKLDTWV
jgi:hypothetical protein